MSGTLASVAEMVAAAGFFGALVIDPVVALYLAGLAVVVAAGVMFYRARKGK